MAVHIRLAENDDCSDITRVLSEAFLEYKDDYTVAAYNETVITPEKVAMRLNDGEVWVALIQDKIVGTIAGIGRNTAYHIRGMGVTPEARGQKVGLLLLQVAEEFALANNYKSLLLLTTPYLKRAIKLYEGFGFRIINEPPFHFFGTPAFSMRKDL